MDIEKISFVIPVYNEEENLPELHNELNGVARSMGPAFEILFVDDGSTDGSGRTIGKLSAGDERVRHVTLRHNCGQSAALAAGFAAATGDVIITLDADLQNDPRDIPALLRHYGSYDMITGCRTRRRDSRWKRFGSRVGNGFRNHMTGENIRDTGCSLKVMRAEYLKKIRMYKGLHRFLPTLMRLEGARVLEVEVNHRPRLHGTTKYDNLGRALSGFHDVLAVRWMIRRRLQLPVGEHNVTR